MKPHLFWWGRVCRLGGSAGEALPIPSAFVSQGYYEMKAPRDRPFISVSPLTSLCQEDEMSPRAREREKERKKEHKHGRNPGDKLLRQDYSRVCNKTSRSRRARYQISDSLHAPNDASLGSMNSHKHYTYAQRGSVRSTRSTDAVAAIGCCHAKRVTQIRRVSTSRRMVVRNDDWEEEKKKERRFCVTSRANYHTDNNKTRTTIFHHGPEFDFGISRVGDRISGRQSCREFRCVWCVQPGKKSAQRRTMRRCR